MQARGFLNYRSKYWWPKVIYCRLCVNQTNLNGKLRKNWEAKQKSGGPWLTQAPLRDATGP